MRKFFLTILLYDREALMLYENYKSGMSAIKVKVVAIEICKRSFDIKMTK